MDQIHPTLAKFIDAANAVIDCYRELERLRNVELKARAEWEKVRRGETETNEKAT